MSERDHGGSGQPQTGEDGADKTYQMEKKRRRLGERGGVRKWGVGEAGEKGREEGGGGGRKRERRGGRGRKTT